MSETPTQIKKAHECDITINDLIEVGAHYGHKTTRWNPKMAPYIYGVYNGIHVINLKMTVPLFKNAMRVLYDVVLNRGRVLFVGTKTQAAELVAETAQRCGQYYINHRWLGGTLTNWSTISSSIKKLVEYENLLLNKDGLFVKKELVAFEKERVKLDRSLGGIREMGGLPHVLVVVDTNKEHLAIKEAKKLGIPIIAILDTNSDPTDIDYPIPGNDDASRSLQFYCQKIADVILAGIEADLAKSGVKITPSTNNKGVDFVKEDGASERRKYKGGRVPEAFLGKPSPSNNNE